MAQIVLIMIVYDCLCVVCWPVLKALRYLNLFSGAGPKTKLTTEILK